VQRGELDIAVNRQLDLFDDLIVCGAIVRVDGPPAWRAGVLGVVLRVGSRRVWVTELGGHANLYMSLPRRMLTVVDLADLREALPPARR
jgi:hypothetical protein